MSANPSSESCVVRETTDLAAMEFLPNPTPNLNCEPSVAVTTEMAISLHERLNRGFVGSASFKLGITGDNRRRAGIGNGANVYREAMRYGVEHFPTLVWLSVWLI